MKISPHQLDWLFSNPHLTITYDGMRAKIYLQQTVYYGFDLAEALDTAYEDLVLRPARRQISESDAKDK